MGGRIRLRLLVDRGSIEIIGNNGRVALSVGVIPADENRALGLFAQGGTARVCSLEIYSLESAWPR
jgi:fructan beta-fructosidase